MAPPIKLAASDAKAKVKNAHDTRISGELDAVLASIAAAADEEALTYTAWPRTDGVDALDPTTVAGLQGLGYVVTHSPVFPTSALIISWA